MSSPASALKLENVLYVKKGPIATAKLPRRVPFGFHGNWMPSV